MKITKVERQKKNLDRVNIYIDDEFAFGLTDELRYKFKLKKGMELSEEILEEILELEKQNKAVNYTVHLLSYRPRSEKEIRERLIEKEYLDHQIDYAIDYCKKLNYINDYDFAESFIRDRINLSKHGAFRIKNDLYQKGVDDSIIDELLEEYTDEESEYDIALELAKKRFYRYRDDDRQAQYRKLSGYLQRRGYSFDVVNKVLNEILE